MACTNKNCFNICLETKINPNSGAEIGNDECSTNFNVIPFIACIDIARLI